MRLVERRAEVADAELQVRARALEPGILEELAELLGGKCTKARGLHFAEADLPDRPQCRRGMRLQLLLDRIQLDANRSTERRRAQAACGPTGENRGNARCSGQPQE